KKWKQAQEILEELLEEHPKSSYYTQALFYQARCLKEQRGKEVSAIEAYQDFLRHRRADQNLKEMAENSIIDLALSLYRRGNGDYLREIERRLRSSNTVVRYYAAIQMSKVDDREEAEKAIPVLKDILEDVKDDELRDYAKLALLRIDPDSLGDYQNNREDSRPRMMYIRVNKEGLDRPTFKLNIPGALADLAFSAISEEDKARIRKEGYDLDRIVNQLLEMRGEVLEIYDADEGVTIKIWIK
ncbi:MAG: tetratricopeptide repeat protein, partial [Candidatus Aminicenantes bacterium]|nr:tetratricopeptide repeat protein [Candidatus Aminicenantes bacterium]